LTHWRRAVIWLAADAEGVAHAIRAGRSLCGAPVVTERFAWPTLTRCSWCLAALRAER